MKLDLFTKGVLLIIAVALCVIMAQGFRAEPVVGSGSEILQVNLVRIGNDPGSVNDLRQLLRAKK